MAQVYVRRQNRYAEPFAFCDKHRNLFRIVDFVAEQPGHEFNRIVCLQVRGSITDQAVSGTVTLVETVPGEFFEEIKDGVGLLFVDAVHAFTSLDEVDAFFRHLHFVLLSHRAAEKIGLTQGISGQDVGRALYLFLVDHNAVGIGTDLFQ